LLDLLLENIQEEGINLTNYLVSYYNHFDAVFVFVGKYPIAVNFPVPTNELDRSLPFRISLRPASDTKKIEKQHRV
jgi:hypothetical protein